MLGWKGRSLEERQAKNKGGAGRKTAGRGVKSASTTFRRGVPIHPAKYPTAEKQVIHWFTQQRTEEGVRMTSRILRNKMKECVINHYPWAEEFKASKGWFRRFMRRHNLAFRRRNNKKSKSLVELSDRVLYFLNSVRRSIDCLFCVQFAIDTFWFVS